MTNIYEKNYSENVKKLQAIIDGREETAVSIKEDTIFKEKLLEVEYGYIIKYMENHRKNFNKRTINRLGKMAIKFNILNSDPSFSERDRLKMLNLCYNTYVVGE